MIEQIYTGCLAQGAYFIYSNGEAAIIDPLRETKPYLDRAEKAGVKIKYVFETHFHADFVSGHVELASKTGAEIIYGPNANPEFKATIASDNQVFTIGSYSIKVIHTPGHTMESSCYLLSDESGKNLALFTGDTLFLGDVGRPDLAQKAASMTQEELAGMLYESIYNKIMPLSDDIIIYPGHGAGSACGKNMMKETQDTLGHQKSMNYALNQPSKESFVQAVTEGLLPPPGYFPLNVALNKKGPQHLDALLSSSLVGYTPDGFEYKTRKQEALILDTRGDGEFAKGFIPGSINIGLGGQFAPWLGALVKDVNQAIVLVCTPGKEEEALIRMSRVGFDNVIGFLKDGFDSWIKAGKPIDQVNRISVDEFAEKYNQNSLIIDVRKEGEYSGGHLVNSNNFPLDFIDEWFASIQDKKGFFLHCQGGYRSMIAASIFKSRGISDFYEVDGGYQAISKTTLPIEASKVPR
jgi:glyoxylase-like metal-dependent hydrolase (beta-lactamase superfamily II)/rhodanese-related sulfurtransferase